MASEMDQPEIEERIREFIAHKLLYSEAGFPYGDEVSFLQEGIIDSLGVLELVEFVQKSFGVKVAQPEVTRANFDSVTALAGFVRGKLSAARDSEALARTPQA